MTSLTKKSKLRKKIIEYSIENNLGHIPSALSMFNYLFYLIGEIDLRKANVIIGKPFGSQSYYLLWNYFYSLDIDNLSYGVKHDEISFIDYSEETLGNALGVAAGYAISSNRMTWCNISDGALQMGSTLEAIQFIGNRKLNILLTIDYNETQLTGRIEEIIGMNVNNISEYFKSFGWDSQIIDSKNIREGFFKRIAENEGPKVVFIRTTKGDGIEEMEKNPREWHYKKLKDINEVTFK